MYAIGNILDKIHDALDARVWDNPGAPKPRLKRPHHSWIIHTVEKTLKDAGYDQLDQWLDLVLTGSLTTYQYSDESDVDVSLFVNVEHFPDWSRSEMIALMVGKVDGTKLPGTPYPLQCFVVPQGVTKQDLYKPGLRSGYDLYDDKWVVPPDPDRVEDVEAQQNGDYVYALESADKMERLLRYDPQQAVNYWHQIHKRRQRDQKAGKGDYAQSNIVYKFLANRGLFPSISSASGEYIASFSVDGEAVEQARDHLELGNPASVKIVGGHAGRYHGLQDGTHEIDVVGWLRPESASKQAWHELAHARQYEEDPERWSHTLQEYWRDPQSHRWEREARELAEEHPFPLVKAAMPDKCPHCGATDEYRGDLCYSCGYGHMPCPRCQMERGVEEQMDNGHCWHCGYTVATEGVRPAADITPETPGLVPPAAPGTLGPQRMGADKARVLFQKFRPNQNHPPGPSGPEMPFIYDPHQDTVFLGPPNAYHWELLRKVPELASQYPTDQDWTKAPFMVNPDHVHGRMTWPGKETDFLGKQWPYETRARINEALGAPPPPEDDGPIWDFSQPAEQSPEVGDR